MPVNFNACACNSRPILYITNMKACINYNIIINIPRCRGNREGVEFHNRGITAIGGQLRGITAIGALGSYIP